MYLSVGKGRYSCPNSQLPPTPLFPLPHPMYSQAGTKNKKQSRIVPCYHPAPLSPVTNGSLLRSGQGWLGRIPLQCASVCIHESAKPHIGFMPCPVLLAVWNGLGFERFLIHSCITLNGFCRAAGVRLSNCCLIHSSSADAYTDGSKPWSGLIPCNII